jgi:hypothetical protein
MKNPGWAGETGEFDLTEAEVRGIDYVGSQPPEGWEKGGVGAYPYQRAERDPSAVLFEGPYRPGWRPSWAAIPTNGPRCCRC